MSGAGPVHVRGAYVVEGGWLTSRLSLKTRWNSTLQGLVSHTGRVRNSIILQGSIRWPDWHLAIYFELARCIEVHGHAQQAKQPLCWMIDFIDVVVVARTTRQESCCGLSE